jgi:CMP-N,N'-diacetyllegionaminic acid synthase
MFKNKKFLAIIAARSGSKSIKDKNLSIINGRTLLYWIVKKALKSKYLDKIYVSTDSIKYQKLSKTYGAYCPILRPKNLSKSDSKEIDYIIHTLEYLSKNNDFEPDYVVRLQPTSPFQFTSDIDESIKKIVKYKDATSIQVVSESTQPPFKALKIYKKKFLKSYFSISNNNVVNRQKLKKAYYRSNIITSKTKELIKSKCQIGNKSLIYKIPTSRSIDINDLYDLEVSRMLNKKYKYL